MREEREVQISDRLIHRMERSTEGLVKYYTVSVY